MGGYSSQSVTRWLVIALAAVLVAGMLLGSLTAMLGFRKAHA